MVIVLTMTTASTVLFAQVASATYAAQAAGTSQALSQTVPAPLAPVAVANGRDVSVTWSPTTLSGGTPAQSYVVRRFDLSSVSQTVLADCILPTASCIERSVPYGTWRYTIQARSGLWVGPQSALSAPLTVSTSSFTFDSSALILSLPATKTGVIRNFIVGETVTYRLDGVAGTVLSGTPTTVNNSTSMAVSVTIPTGTSDAPHSVFVVGSLGSVASAAIDIVIPPTLQSLQMFDVDVNGKVDRVLATFSENLDAYTAGVAPWTLANVPSGGSLSSVTVSGAVATLTLAEGASAANTAVGSFTIALSANSAGIRDVNGHTTSFAATAPTDSAAPAALLLTMFDANANGKVDQLTMSFSETLATYTAPSSVWTVSNAPSGASILSIAVASPTVTVTLTEGAGTASTAVGSFLLNLAANAAGIRDAAGNLSSFSKTPLDGAKPIRLTQEMFDDNVDGKVDRVLATFTEPLAAFTASPAVFTLTSAPSSATIASVTIVGAGANINLTQGTGTATTAIGSFKVQLASNAAGIRDAAGNLASYTAVAPTDKAAPALTALTLLDNNGNGKVDRVTAKFSETMSTYTAGITPWTLTGIPSSGSLASVSLSSSTLTLTLTEGAGAADTTVASMTVAMAASATGARDAAGNLGSFTTRTPIDGAKPQVLTIADTSGSLDGLAQPGDSLVLTFTEALAVASVPTAADLSLSDPVGTGSDTLTIAAVTNGARSTGADGYVSADGTVATFAGSLVTLGNSNKTITITIAAVCTGTGCSGLIQQTTNATYSFLGATTLKDLANNLVSTTTKTQSIRLF